ncbi:MAG TPA: hypothetical protein VD927_04975 [Chryseosolibacter sp.]|nr:hypothetical protein [Chryseosolibacter sp.]
MAFIVIVVVVLILAFFLWRSYGNNRKQTNEKGRPGSNPNPNTPSSSERL